MGERRMKAAVNLHNMVTVSQQRLGKRLARLSSIRLAENLCRGAILHWLRCQLVGDSLPRTPFFYHNWRLEPLLGVEKFEWALDHVSRREYPSFAWGQAGYRRTVVRFGNASH